LSTRDSDEQPSASPEETSACIDPSWTAARLAAEFEQRLAELLPLVHEAQAIDERQVVEAVQLTLELERRFGWPVDVECAWEKEILYVLQCRPITTL